MIELLTRKQADHQQCYQHYKLNELLINQPLPTVVTNQSDYLTRIELLRTNRRNILASG